MFTNQTQPRTTAASGNLTQRQIVELEVSQNDRGYNSFDTIIAAHPGRDPQSFAAFINAGSNVYNALLDFTTDQSRAKDIVFRDANKLEARVIDLTNKLNESLERERKLDGFLRDLQKQLRTEQEERGNADALVDGLKLRNKELTADLENSTAKLQKAQKSAGNALQVTQQNTRLQGQITELNTKQQAALNIIRKHESEHTNLASKHKELERDFEALQSKHEKESEAAATNHQLALDKLQSDNKSAVESLEKDHKSCLETLTTGHQQSLQATSSKHEAATNTLEKQHQDDLASVGSQHNDAVEKLKTQQRADIDKIKSGHREQVDKLTTHNADETKKRQQSYDKLRSEKGTTETTLRKAQADLQSANNNARLSADDADACQRTLRNARKDLQEASEKIADLTQNVKTAQKQASVAQQGEARQAGVLRSEREFWAKQKDEASVDSREQAKKYQALKEQLNASAAFKAEKTKAQNEAQTLRTTVGRLQNQLATGKSAKAGVLKALSDLQFKYKMAQAQGKKQAAAFGAFWEQQPMSDEGEGDEQSNTGGDNPRSLHASSHAQGDTAVPIAAPPTSGTPGNNLDNAASSPSGSMASQSSSSVDSAAKSSSKKRPAGDLPGGSPRPPKKLYVARR